MKAKNIVLVNGSLNSSGDKILISGIKTPENTKVNFEIQGVTENEMRISITNEQIIDAFNRSFESSISMSLKKDLWKHNGTGLTGTFVEKRNGYYGEIMIIKLENGREYFAPTNEFQKISDN